MPSTVRALVSALVLCCATLVGANATAAELWFGGVDPVVQRDRGISTPVDYMSLFEANAPWRTVAAGIRVFEISTPFARRSSDEELARVVNDMRRRRIPLGLVAEINRGHDGCGVGVNGYSGLMDSAASRLRHLGADLRYVAMDEPLWFGHNFNGKNACRDSIPKIAQAVALGVAELRRWYPNVQIGDIEPISFQTLARADWLDQLRDWMSAYQAATGTPLAFIQADLVWQSNWAPSLQALRSEAHSRGMQFGLYFNGDARDQTDLAWTNRALSRYHTVMVNPQLAPDQILIGSWYPRPTRFLPEDQPGTLTNVALQVLRR
jgi:hypothetical protein